MRYLAVIAMLVSVIVAMAAASMLIGYSPLCGVTVNQLYTILVVAVLLTIGFAMLAKLFGK